jgi:hypothetical protein
VVFYETYRAKRDEKGCILLARPFTKSFAGTLAAKLMAEKNIHRHAPVVSLFPVLKGSAQADASIAYVLDVTAAMEFSENYADPNVNLRDYGYRPIPLKNDRQEFLVVTRAGRASRFLCALYGFRGGSGCAMSAIAWFGTLRTQIPRLL